MNIVAIIKASPNSPDADWIMETKKAGANGVIIFPISPQVVLDDIKHYCLCCNFTIFSKSSI